MADEQVAVIAYEEGDVVNSSAPGNIVAHTHIAEDISDSGSLGRSVLRTTNEPALRSLVNLGYTDLRDYGAATTATDAENSGALSQALGDSPVYVPRGTYTTATAQSAIIGRLYGEGTIVDSAGNERGRMFSAIDAAPTSLGDWSSVLTAFNGDLSRSQIVMEHRVSGTGTLGTPATGYLYTPEAYPVNLFLYNNTGHNEQTTGNDGRTAVVGININGYQASSAQGDLIPFRSTTFVTGAKASATSFLANPAGSVVCGGVYAGNAGVFLQPQEFIMKDNGYDVAGAGPTVSMYRENNTGALDCFWFGFRSQSKGSKNVDVAYSVFGPHSIGIDMTTATIGTAAMALKADQKIYGNATAADWRKASSFPNDYISYQSNISGWGIVAGGTVAVQITSSQVAVAGGANLLIASTGVFKVAGSSQATTGTSTATFTATNKPGATTGASPALWLRVDVNGVTHYAPLWAA